MKVAKQLIQDMVKGCLATALSGQDKEYDA